jgi:hypothetical protein
MFGVLTLLLGVAGSAVWVGVNGVVLAMVSGRRGSLTEAAGAGLARYASFLGLWVAAMGAHALTIGGAYLTTGLLADLAVDGSSELTSYGIATVCVLAASVVALGIATVHDHARVRCLETGDAAWRSGLWACAYVVRERRAMPLSLGLVFTTVIGWVIYQAAGTLVAADSALGLTISLVWAQAFMAFRALVRVWAFASAVDLQSGWEMP